MLGAAPRTRQAHLAPSTSTQHRAPIRSLHMSSDFDVIVIGAGHAGCEAAWAAARLGCRVGLVHAVGRDGRAHAVQSGDWRHGEGPSRPRDRRARRADGPRDRRDGDSVQAAQPEPWTRGVVAARAGGQARVRPLGARGAASEPNITWLFRRAGTNADRGTGASSGWRSRTATSVTCDALVVTTGTFLNGLVHIGDEQRPSGRAGEPPTHELAESLRECGFEMGRLKTGTPPRLDRRSIDFSRFQEERGDDPIVPFSFMSDRIVAAAGRRVICCTRPIGVHDLVRAQHRAIAALQRPDHGHRAALLSVARRQGHAVSRQGAASDLSRAGRASTSTRST